MSVSLQNGDLQKFTSPELNADTVGDKFVIFENWLLDNGAKFPKLELKDYGDEVRGCHAISPIDDDEVIIEIPLQCLITVEMGKDTDVGRAILASNIDLDAPKHIFLMLFMLIDRKDPNSFFKPYYDILPATLNNMPIFWTEQELDLLTGSFLLTQIAERNLAIENDYNSICELWPSFNEICDLREFAWARMAVCSRNFGLMINGLRTAALVPYADMLNHYRPRETKWQFEDARQGFTIISLNPIATGAQVYDSYGQKCNHRFLLNYGFSVEHNVEEDGFCPNEVPFLFHVDRKDPLFDRKCAMWQRDSFLPSRRLRLAVTDNDNWRLAVAMLRIIGADGADLDCIVDIYGQGSYRSVRDLQMPLNVQNEVRAWTVFKAMCEDYLSRYKSSYEQDCAALASDQLRPFSNERHAIIQLKGEKHILRFYKSFADTALEMLQCRQPAELNHLVEQCKFTCHPMIVKYCQTVVLRLKRDEERELEYLQRHVDLTKPTVV